LLSLSDRGHWFHRSLSPRLQVNNDHDASCFVGVSGHCGGGFPHASSIIRSVISSLTFKRRQPLCRDLAWVALHLGLIALILFFMVLPGYSAMGTYNPGDVGVLLDKPIETDPVESAGRVP
ncbi:unnamed protein product, partial [Prunus brigantina]